jgi:DNA replication and repair protein RecF
MQISLLELTNFRNFKKLSLSLAPGVNLLLGPNAQGKTNILEAVHLLSTTRSFRTNREIELVSFDEEFARVAGGGVEVFMKPGEKVLKLHGKPARAAEVLGSLRSVLFSPEDMTLLSGAPQERRDYLDELISRIDRRYLLTLISYQRTLKQRNKLLWLMRESGGREEELSSWNDLLERDGADILARRGEVAGKLQRELKPLAREILGTESLVLTYSSRLGSAGAPTEAIREAFHQALIGSKQAEVRAATSLIGPHRDDFRLDLGVQSNASRSEDFTPKMEARDLGHFGSRGEQRAAILALKLAEVALNEEEKGERPILLLDDVLSELDEDHRARLLGEVGRQQTILSSTSLEGFPESVLEQAQIFQVKAGTATASKDAAHAV